ncbi:sigma-70 family RNA polymerase sigma factor [Nannocystis bainbridge]|uniref:Sigma-70 family RNA polymerase sigma factor n=1 Tax=Nannocystis bainbridge TaxID=2995303 RepID=A0ABT5EBG6_9BACT|nr:sigma-70 family RNA polymerase sigma factor [Nannocystis bainbridge]MDC0723199.1 sigma-70 family RNA polymerase sigma factor [Nannocystis bainbridge]
MITLEMRGAWRELERKLRPFVARRVAGADAEDVLQDIFLRMQKSLPHLRDEDRFGPWVYQVARSAIVDHQRAALRHPLASLEAADEPAADDEEDDGAVERELATYLAPFVAALPSPYREALTLTELEGLTQKDAAAMLGVSLSGMKSRVQRGRARLRVMLDECCDITVDARGRVIGCEPRPDYKLPDGCCQ